MSPVQIELRDSSFDSFQELIEHRKTLSEIDDHGACSIFVGTMREYNGGDRVFSMQLEHYPGMTEKQLAAIVEEIKEANELFDVLVLHRVGVITPGEEIVLVCCWSSHRKAAFDSCRAIMEALKSKAPFWKKETLNDGERWVARNTPG